MNEEYLEYLLSTEYCMLGLSYLTYVAVDLPVSKELGRKMFLSIYSATPLYILFHS